MYALAGLYIVDRPAFEQEVRKFEQNQTKFDYTDGDIIYRKSVSEFTTILKSGHYPSLLIGRDVRKEPRKELPQ